jgi:MFS family permease
VRATRTAVVPLSSPPFRRYLLGQLPSLTGSWAQVVALSWWVESLDPRALGWVIALQFLPSLVLGPWFGVVADRHDRRRLLMLAECGLGLVAAAYALASLTGVLTVPVIYVLAADPRMRGRVMSLFALALLGGTSTGAPVASSLAAALGARALLRRHGRGHRSAAPSGEQRQNCLHPSREGFGEGTRPPWVRHQAADLPDVSARQRRRSQAMYPAL